MSPAASTLLSSMAPRELGFQQLSELAARSDDSVGARALLAFLASPATAIVKRRHGMEPAS